MKRGIVHILLIIVIFCILASSVAIVYYTQKSDKSRRINAQGTVPVACNTPVSFVNGTTLQRFGTAFAYGGKAVCLYGATIYTSSGMDAPTANWKYTSFPSRIDWDLNLAAQANINVIRPTDQTNDAGDDVYNPVVWTNMDYLVHAARSRGMFVLLDLSTFANNLKNKGLNPYDPNLESQWKAYINFVVNRYKNEPNISNYSLQGEVNPVNSSLTPNSTTQGYLDFFTRVTNDVYDAETAGGAARHLIEAGGLSHLNETNSGIPWQQIFGLTHVDMASIHVYPSNPLDPINTNEDLKVTIPMIGTWATQNNKPSIIEEYGFQQAVGDSARASAMKTIEQAAIDNGFRGIILWNMGPELLGGPHYDVNPGWPLAWSQFVNGAATFYQLISQVPGTLSSPSPSITSTAPPIQQTPSPTPIIPTPTPVSTSDRDNDGFSDAQEQFMGTNINQSCGISAWPPDMDDNNAVNFSDVLKVASHSPTSNANAVYDRRADMNADGKVDATDVNIALSYTGKWCVGGIPGFSVTDVHSVGVGGSSSRSGSVFSSTGLGGDIWGTSDTFRYISGLLGDRTVIARVVSQTNSDPWAKAGVMIRENTSTGARHAMLVTTPGNGLAFQWRSSTNGQMAHIAVGSCTLPNCWLKLTKSGSTISAYTSSNGSSWTMVGNVNISFTEAAKNGFAVSSQSTSTSSTATFDNFSIQ